MPEHCRIFFASSSDFCETVEKRFGRFEMEPYTSGEDPSEVESLSKINYRTEGIKMKDSVNDGKGTIRQGQGGEEDVQETDS